MNQTEWLEKVLHDLVKYLEMMPRSLNWDELEEHDADVLFASIFETRVDGRGVRSASDIWKVARDSAPEQVGASGVLQDVDQRMDTLLTLAEPLRSGGDVSDPAALREAIFAVGDRLRALREE